MSEKPSLYAALVAAGCKVDNHESDLYVQMSPESSRILREYRVAWEMFVSQVDGKAWVNVPFIFDPFWERRQNRPSADVS